MADKSSHLTLTPTSLGKILPAFRTLQVLHQTACVTLNAGFQNQKHQSRGSVWIRKAIVHISDNTVSPAKHQSEQMNVQNHWGWVNSSFLFWCLVGLFPIFQSQSPNELQGDRSLSITRYFSSRVISAPSENHKA